MSSSKTDQTRATNDQNYRGLWGAVVLQAKDDIQNGPLRSIEYAQAVAFFTGAGEWAHTRTMIGDFLELHRDDLEAFGRRCIYERLKAEGLDTLPLAPQPAVRAAPSRREGREQVLARQPTPAPRLPIAMSRPAQGRRNPFFPHGITAQR
jgi:hypothetical protein